MKTLKYHFNDWISCALYLIYLFNTFCIHQNVIKSLKEMLMSIDCRWCDTDEIDVRFRVSNTQ